MENLTVGHLPPSLSADHIVSFVSLRVIDQALFQLFFIIKRFSVPGSVCIGQVQIVV